MYGNKIGEMAWMDLSVPNAGEVSDFYQAVLGWSVEPVGMTLDNESYNDFVMTAPKPNSINKKNDESAPSEQTFMTGICHAKGDNQDMPASWLPYFLVKDLDASIVKVIENKGTLATKIKSIGADRYAVIKDPSGAMVAIYQKKEA